MPSVTAIKVVERSSLPPISFELLSISERPERLEGGSPEQLLKHIVRYGAYCRKLETQVSSWQAWYRKQSEISEKNHD